DPHGNWKLDPAWQSVSTFSGDRASVTREKGDVLIDAEGNVLSKPFERIDPMIDGMARVKRGDDWNFIAANGKLLSRKWFAAAPHYGDGLATVKDADDRWFFLLVTGKLVGPFDAAYPAHCGMARFVENERVGFRDVT